MVFSTETIQKSQRMSMSSLNESIDDEYMRFENTLTRLLDENAEFDALLADYIGEGFHFHAGKDGIDIRTGIDPVEIFQKIIDAFIKLIEDLAGNFKVFLSSLLSKNARLAAYKTQLYSFRAPIHYNRYYYEYSNLDMDTSYSSYATELEKEYNTLLDGLDRCKSARDITTLAEIISDLRDQSEYNEDEFDALRGRVLRLGKKVTADEFKDEVFKFYRCGEDTLIDPNAKRDELNLDGARVHEAVDQYFNSSNHIRVIERDKQKLKAEANRQKYMIKSTDLKDFTSPGIEPTGEIRNAYKSIITNKCRKVKAVCDIYTILFDGKIDAYKEYNVTNKNICLEAIKVIAKG